MQLPRNYTGVGIALSDTQIPFHDKRAVEATRKFLKTKKPNLVLWNGDIVDFDTCSRFRNTQDSRRSSGYQIRADCDDAGDLMSRLNDIAQCDRSIFLGGNHEERPEKLVREVLPVLDGAFTIADWLGLARRRIEYVAYEHGNGRVSIGDPFRGLVVLHGFMVRSTSKGRRGLSAMAHMERLDCSVMHGHTNSCVSVQVCRPNRTMYAVEQGCLSDNEAQARQYAPIPDAQHGIGYFEMSKGILTRAEAIRIVNGTINFDGIKVKA